MTAEQIEYQRSNAAVAANADTAYREGATGRGIIIAVIDTGISPNVSEFSGRIDPASADLESNRGLTDANGHGTAMASIALAARDGRGMHGLAFEATLLSYNASRPDNCTVQNCPTYSDAIARAIDAAVAAGARVINMSFTSDQVPDNVVAAVRRAAGKNVVMVIAAGNESANEPLQLSRVIAEAGMGQVIIAGAHDMAGRPYRFNNGAGSGPAATSYLMALGVDVNMTGLDGLILTQSGTSAATAAISGAAALIAQARPNLTAPQIVSLLLNSATDLGKPGRDATYGNGRLNLAAAFTALPPRT
jgi:subtilisin family serine protease